MKAKLVLAILLSSISAMAAVHVGVSIGGGWGYGPRYYAPAYYAPAYYAPGAYVSMRFGPPVVRRVAYIPASPGYGYTWIPGYYYPVGPRYYWRAGYWSRPPYAGARWYGPRYHGGRYYHGHWRR